MQYTLNERALLTQLTISQWSARRFDKKTSKKVAHDYSVAEGVGRYNKALLPGAQELANVHAKSTYIRALYYRNTLPWGMEGTQILPCDNYVQFFQEFNQHRNEWEYLVNEFVRVYPKLMAEARAHLGGLFDINDYPADVRDKFNIDIAVMPVPSSDFRVRLADGQVAAIKQDVEYRVHQAQKQALGEAWNRLFSRLETVYEKIVDPTSIFRDSLIENVRETCDLLGRMNIMEDPDFESMRQEILLRVASCDPDTLRHDLTARADTAAEVKSIMDKMQGYM